MFGTDEGGKRVVEPFSRFTVGGHGFPIAQEYLKGRNFIVINDKFLNISGQDWFTVFMSQPFSKSLTPGELLALIIIVPVMNRLQDKFGR